ncbi:MAG TPA: vitamin K epoxide reductase family protein, partial [Candidatus Bathyarchaeia archaeon]|nr:vitamin K epoxide reductase family protein [Candidatus Bathyarchaeia archaeon]
MTRRVSWKKLTLLVAMSIFGLWASTMVLVVYYTLNQQLPACKLPTPGAPVTIDCQAVLSSPYSSIYGVPLELLAVFYFIINLAFIYMISFGPERLFRTSFRSLFIWRFVGLAMVPYLLVVELGILKAICI